MTLGEIVRTASRAGGVATARPGSVRLFLSSTFSDMRFERDHLITVVYPELEERLAGLGLTFFDIDLRWGIPRASEVGEEERRNSWSECRRRIDDAFPFFVALVGHRYGSLAVPDELSAAERAVWTEQLSYTELEIRYGAFGETLGGSGKWKGSRWTGFYLRNYPSWAGGHSDQYIEDISSTLIQDRVAAADGSILAAQPKVEVLRRNIRAWVANVRSQGAKQAAHSDDCAWLSDYDVTWTSKGPTDLSIFGRMVLEDLWRGVLTHPAYASLEAWRKAVPDQQGLDELLHSNEPIPEATWRAYVAAYADALSPLEAESLTLTRFREERSRYFFGRQRELRGLLSFAEGRSNERVRIVFAPPGRGKTALMCELANRIASQSDVQLVECYVGAVDRLSDLSGLISRILAAVAPTNRFADPLLARRVDSKALVRELLTALQSDRRRSIILIDAIDQLLSGSDLAWLPLDLPDNVRFIVSCADLRHSARATEREQNTSARIAETRAGMVLALPQLERSEVPPIVHAMMEDHGKEVSALRAASIAALPQSVEPLYLSALLRELRVLSGDNVDAQVDAYIEHAPMSASELFDQIMSRVEALGRDSVALWASTLVVCRSGMSATGLAQVLGKFFGPEGVSTAHRIRRALRSYLQLRDGRIDTYHRDFSYALAERYTDVDRTILHRTIADVLYAAWIDPNTRDAYAMAERFYHLIEAREWDQAMSALADFEALDARFQISSGGLLFSEDVAHAYVTARGENLNEVAQRIIELFLDVLRSEPARRAQFTLARVNAWLIYREDREFFNALLQRGSRFELDDQAFAVIDPVAQELIFRCRSRFAAMTRRDEAQELSARLAHAQSILLELLGANSQKTPGFADWITARMKGILRRTDDRAGTDAYELAYIYFLKGELKRAARWFLFSAHLSRIGKSASGEWISRCLAANCHFIESNRTGHFRKTLRRAGNIFNREAERGDPDAQRWIMNVLQHEIEVALVRGDRSVVQNCYARLRNDPWIAAFGDRKQMLRMDAHLALAERRFEDAAQLFGKLVEELRDGAEQKARAVLNYGVACQASGDEARAREAWAAGLDLPAEAGNRPWQDRIRERLRR